MEFGYLLPPQINKTRLSIPGLRVCCLSSRLMPTFVSVMVLNCKQQKSTLVDLAEEIFQRKLGNSQNLQEVQRTRVDGYKARNTAPNHITELMRGKHPCCPLWALDVTGCLVVCHRNWTQVTNVTIAFGCRCGFY